MPPRPRRRLGPPARARPSSQQHPPPSLTRPTPNTDFEICLYDHHIYQPGLTPPQPPISLLPIHDTDAFIVGKLVSPFGVAYEDNFDDDDDDDEDLDLDFKELRRRTEQKLLAATAAACPSLLLNEEQRQQQQQQHVRRVLNYVVGWPDVPYTRLLVPCTEILDYVSPRTLEDWEYSVSAGASATPAGAAAAAATQKRRQRAQPNKTSATAGVSPIKHEEEEDEVPSYDGAGDAGRAIGQSSHQPNGGPQRKRRRRRRRLLLGPSKQRKAVPPAAAAAVATETPPPSSAIAKEKTQNPVLARTSSGTTVPGENRAFGGSAVGKTAKVQRVILPMGLAAGSPAASRARATSTTGVESRPVLSSPSTARTSDAAAATVFSPSSDRQQLLAQSIPSLTSGKQRTGLSLTQPYPCSRPSTGASADGKAASMAVDGASVDGSGDADATVVDNANRGAWANDSSNNNAVGAAGDDMYFKTTAPVSSVSGTDEYEDEDEEDEAIKQHPQGQPPRRVTYNPPPTLPLQVPSSQQNTSSAALIAKDPRAETPRSDGLATNSPKQERAAQEATYTQPVAGDKMDVDRQEESEVGKPGPGEEDEEDDLYEVECIEDDYLMQADEISALDSHAGDPGAGAEPAPVRLFHVRWKGDWPPDQNPTWEPAENLPPDMVRQYLKRAARRKTSKSVQGRGNRGLSASPGD